MWVKSALAEQVRHFFAGTVQPSFDGPFRAVEHFGNFFDGQFLLIKQDETLLIFGTQCHQSFLDFFGIIALVGSSSLRQPIRLQVGRSRPATTFFPMGSTTVPRDGQQPRSQWTFTVPTMQVAERSQEDLLRDVLGIVATAEHSQAESKNHAFETLNEQPLVGDIASQATLDQLDLADVHAQAGFPLWSTILRSVRTESITGHTGRTRPKFREDLNPQEIAAASGTRRARTIAVGCSLWPIVSRI